MWDFRTAFSIGRWLCAIMTASAAFNGALAQTPEAAITDALENITNLIRDGRIGYATIWDGNKFVQCHRASGGDLHCEAAGTLMQPSLRSVLTTDALQQLAALGWTLNSSFGNYVKDFSADVPTDRIATHILKVLTAVYAANTNDLEFNTKWVANLPCPPRAGYSQNLAGSVNDAASIQRYAVRTCSFISNATDAKLATNSKELIELYGAQAAAEIQRLRLNSTRRVWVIFDAGIGYVQCAPEIPMTAVYCEAQSAESWPALAAVLTPARVASLKRAGYVEPGRAPNYSRRYLIAQFSDAAIGNEILTLLHEVYGYSGATRLKFRTE